MFKQSAMSVFFQTWRFDEWYERAFFCDISMCLWLLV